ncbi:alpha-L-fucosidase-like [Mytilus edulis]|uniref:alpha-L-fucosidase-like n=1 Tax=Mytilus edulis TaxID=6550 RepID=UPI0039F05E0D
MHKMNRRQRDFTVKCLGLVSCLIIVFFLFRYLTSAKSSELSDGYEYDNPFEVVDNTKKKQFDIKQHLQNVIDNPLEIKQHVKNIIQEVLPQQNEPTESSSIDSNRYSPNWEALDKRPLPKWFDEAKIGIFIHWGLFSVPSFGSEWFWWSWKGKEATHKIETKAFMKKNYRSNYTYADFAPDFTAEFFNATEWADVFKNSGAKYVVLTAKHHEGYTNWPSAYSYSWNSLAIGPKKDLVGQLGAAVREKDLKFGLYHSLYEWFHPLYLRDKRNNFQTQDFVRAKTMPELYELVNVYKPDIIWSDGEWEAEDTYWNSTEFIAWLYNDSPVKDTVVTNDRWGKSVRCKHGGFLGCNDRYNPGILQKRKWENCMTIDKKSWGFRREANLKDYLTIEKLLLTMVETISCGGNILINIGPAHDGTISAVYLERLSQMGEWLKVNGEAIYFSVPWNFQNDHVNQHVWYTKRVIDDQASVYAIALKWPHNNKLQLAGPITGDITNVTMLGYNTHMKWTADPSGGIHIDIPFISYKDMPCKWAWVFKMTGLTNS